MSNLRKLALKIQSNGGKLSIIKQIATIRSLQKFSCTLDLTNEAEFTSSLSSLSSLTSMSIVAQHLSSSDMKSIISSLTSLRDISLDLRHNKQIARVIEAVADTKNSSERVKIIGGTKTQQPRPLVPALTLLNLLNGNSMRDLQLHYLNINYQVKGHKKLEVKNVLKPFVTYEFTPQVKSKAKKAKLDDNDAAFK
jgi:hypothetical protein